MPRRIYRFLTVFSLLFSGLIFNAHANEPKKLVITGASTWEPFSFLDAKGQPQGIMIDFWRLYGQKNGVNVEFKLMPWSESLEALKNGQADIHGGLGYSSARAEFLSFSHALPFEPYEVYLFADKSLPEDGVSHEKIGSVLGSLKHEFITSFSDRSKLALHNSFGDLLSHAMAGDVKLFIDDLNTANYAMAKAGKEGQFIPLRYLYSFPLHFAVAKGDTDTLGEVSRGLSKISDGEVMAITSKWYNHPEILKWWKDLHPVLLAVGLCLALAALLVVRRVLKRRTNEWQQALSDLQKSNNALQLANKTDPVTGLTSRRGFIEHLNGLRFHPHCYTVVVFDLVKFSAINQQWGHQAGDAALKQFGLQLSCILPKNAHVSRVGGDEFAVVFDNAGQHEADLKLEVLRRQLERNPMRIEQATLPWRYLTGIASYPKDGHDPDRLLAIAFERASSRSKGPKDGLDSLIIPKHPQGV